MAHARYKDKDGNVVPSVTTIIGRFKNSNALLWWAFKQGKLAERGEINSLYDKRDEAADAGTLAHSLVECHINGIKDPFIPDDEIGKMARQGFKNYLKWQENNKIQIIEQEVEMVSEEMKCGGRLDAIGIDSDMNLCICDWKTSNAIYADYLIQIAAYKAMWEEKYPDKQIKGGYHLLRFSKEEADFAHHYYSDLSDALEQFKLFRKAYEIDKKLSKRA